MNIIIITYNITQAQLFIGYVYLQLQGKVYPSIYITLKHDCRRVTTHSTLYTVTAGINDTSDGVIKIIIKMYRT